MLPLVVVTDNGPAMKSIAVARWFAARSHLAHVRTRHRAPWTNGVVERWFESLKYEHLIHRFWVQVRGGNRFWVRRHPSMSERTHVSAGQRGIVLRRCPQSSDKLPNRL